MLKSLQMIHNLVRIPISKAKFPFPATHQATFPNMVMHNDSHISQPTYILELQALLSALQPTPTHQ
jgi:hypothetical protein